MREAAQSANALLSIPLFSITVYWQWKLFLGPGGSVVSASRMKTTEGNSSAKQLSWMIFSYEALRGATTSIRRQWHCTELFRNARNPHADGALPYLTDKNGYQNEIETNNAMECIEYSALSGSFIPTDRHHTIFIKTVYCALQGSVCIEGEEAFY